MQHLTCVCVCAHTVLHFQRHYDISAVGKEFPAASCWHSEGKPAHLQPPNRQVEKAAVVCCSFCLCITMNTGECIVNDGELQHDAAFINCVHDNNANLSSTYPVTQSAEQA